MSFHLIDIIFLLFALVVCGISYHLGFLKRISGFISCAAAFTILYFFFVKICAVLKLTQNLQKVIAYIIAFVVLWFIIRLLLAGVAKRLTDVSVLGAIDKILGLIVGLAQALIIICVISFALYYLAKDIALQSLTIQYIIHLLHI